MKRAFKYRFHPTSAQAAELLRTFGCVRKAYNLALAARAEAWKSSGTRLGHGQTSAMLTAWKKTEEFGYLAEVSSVPLQQALRLVRENQTLVIEDLIVRNMVKNHKLARAVHDAAWRELRSMLEYEAAWYGRELITVGRWFPSTRLCSTCGALAEAMPLSVREWTCEGCGAAHDRDGNASVNLLAAGLAAAACGADARPHRGPSLGRGGPW